jgi:hypothetical protein
MGDLIYEHEYAREMLLAALRRQADDGQGNCAEDVTVLLEQALEAGCGRTALIVELAHLGARLFTVSTGDDPLGIARETIRQMAWEPRQNLSPSSP